MNSHNISQGTIIMLFAVSCFFGTYEAGAQQMEGKIYYQHNTKVEFDAGRFEQMTEERRTRMKERMSEMGKTKRVLVFTKTATLYRNFSVEKDALDEADWEQQGSGSRWQMMRAQSTIYQNLEDLSTIEQREAFDKKFVIKDAAERPSWKLTGKSETILDYPCMEAIYQKNDSTQITAWFNPRIPVPGGPAGYSELPGIIMKLIINDGATEIYATNIKFYSPESKEIEKPEKGKEITSAEFDLLMEEKRKEMREMYGGGNH